MITVTIMYLLTDLLNLGLRESNETLTRKNLGCSFLSIDFYNIIILLFLMCVVIDIFRTFDYSIVDGRSNDSLYSPIPLPGVHRFLFLAK